MHCDLTVICVIHLPIPMRYSHETDMIQAYLWTCTLRSSCGVEGQCGHSVARFRLAAMCQMGVATCWAGARGIKLAFFVFHSAPSATACCQRDALSTDRLRPGSAVVTPPLSSDDSSSSSTHGSTASNAPPATPAAPLTSLPEAFTGFRCAPSSVPLTLTLF